MNTEDLTGFYGEDSKYGTFDELKEQLLYRKVVEWTEDKIVLDDGTVVTIEMSEWDCCASAGGRFTNVELDAAITDITIGDKKRHDLYDGDTYESSAVIKLYHNQNEIAQAEATADAGNGGFYYSVASLLVKDVFYRVVESGETNEEEVE
ncbi:hypothetical protein J4760_04155 [Salinicoccus sp. ID82-1]|uniref:DUF7448 domain-containing protein n=1 Tax=Salinicoccus sp. ID82-1 TaxID=2820269 RepID=UPI001F24987E|nr:hypothetical protein [Salinicoccus sp. ID82-1]MCG1009245.1 hypothetical protein [Salinicoccus sp. ID82-1]